MTKPYGVKDTRLWLVAQNSVCDPHIGEPYASQIEAELDAYIARAISEAVAAEREAIIAFFENQTPTVVGKVFAAAIRKRGEG